MDKRKRIVVVGGGFAGLNFVKHIDKRRYEVVLVDRNNYHSFPPLFYQIASSGLEPGSICFPFRHEFRRGKSRGVAFHLGEIEWIDPDAKRIKTQYETILYDYLVLAVGTTNNFFGNDSLRDSVFTLKSTVQAMRVRNEVLSRLERASICGDPESRRRMLSFTVVGGGPAGVEIAGALGEMKRYILPRNYPSIPPSDVTIRLIEGSPRLLGSMSAKSSADALRYLGELMVEVHTGEVMKDYSGGIMTLASGSTFPTATVIWTAGVTGVPLNFLNAAIKPAHGGRLSVDRFNRVASLDGSVFAIGDLAIMTSEEYPRGHPQVAQVAIQQGRNLARNLNTTRMDTPFTYRDKGSMATIGRNRAVVDMRHSHLRGFPAWLAWMFVHLLSLLGMRNKINVLTDWIWDYFTYSTSMRLLLEPSRFPLRWRWGEK